MFQNIMVALDNTSSDQILLEQAQQLAITFKAKLLLVHVADGWAARQFDQLKLTESEEMRADQTYLETCAQILEKTGCKVSVHLLLGEPAEQLLKIVDSTKVELLMLRTHGHRLLGDLVYGQTIETVRHKVKIPLYIVPA